MKKEFIVIIAFTIIIASAVSSRYVVSAQNITDMNTNQANNLSTSQFSNNTSKVIATNNTQSLQDIIPSTVTAQIQNMSGNLASVQFNETGDPIWILSGKWRMVFTDLNSSSFIKSESTTNDTTIIRSIPLFSATVTMVNPNGQEKHTHRILDFRPTVYPTLDIEDDHRTITINGTAIITTKDIDYFDVPMTIKMFGKGAIMLDMDTNAVQNDFGVTPVYGTIRATPR